MDTTVYIYFCHYYSPGTRFEIKTDAISGFLANQIVLEIDPTRSDNFKDWLSLPHVKLKIENRRIRFHENEEIRTILWRFFTNKVNLHEKKFIDMFLEKFYK